MIVNACMHISFLLSWIMDIGQTKKYWKITCIIPTLARSTITCILFLSVFNLSMWGLSSLLKMVFNSADLEATEADRKYVVGNYDIQEFGVHQMMDQFPICLDSRRSHVDLKFQWPEKGHLRLSVLYNPEGGTCCSTSPPLQRPLQLRWMLCSGPRNVWR